MVRDIIAKYNIKDEDFWIQSDNAPTQYKTKHAFSLYQKLADDFNLCIIHIYRASGHGKGVIDAISSFGAKNILTHNIIVQDVSFTNSDSIVNYLATKKPDYSFTHVPALEVVTKCNAPHTPKEIKDCMKQHMVFQSNKVVILKKYLSECNPCRKFEFDNCERQVEKDQNLDVEIEDYYFAKDNGSQDEQIFDFVDIPSFVTLLTGANAEPLCFFKVIDKEIADGTLTDKWGHIISPKARYFTYHYIKTLRSRNISYKKFETLTLVVYITPDEIQGIYVEINDDMLLNANTYSALIQKSK